MTLKRQRSTSRISKRGTGKLAARSSVKEDDKGTATLPAAAVKYDDALTEWLRSDPEEASAYLQESFRDGNIQVFLMALRNVTKAYGGVGKLANKTGLNREALYRALSEHGNPSLSTLTTVLGALGLRMEIVPASKENSG